MSSSPIAPLLILFALAAAVLLLAILMWKSLSAAPRSRRRHRTDDDLSQKAKIGLGFDPDLPLSARSISLKVCPECRELILLGATVCKYCGGATAAVVAQTPPGDATLRLDRKQESR
jgi:hypothetical protein